MARQKKAKSTPEQELVYVLLDSNVIQNLGVEGLQDELKLVLQDLIAKGYTLAFSDVSVFELFNESSVSKEIEISDALGAFTRFEVTQQVWIAAAHLGCMYKEDGVHPEQVGLADKVVGATAILSNSYILTFDVRDFPRPFFKELVLESLGYTSKKGIHCYAPLALFQPHLEIVGQQHQTRMDKAQKILVPPTDPIVA